MTKKQKIVNTKNKIKRLESKYTREPTQDNRDKLIKARRELALLTNVTLTGSLYTDVHYTTVVGNDSRTKCNSVTKL